jgi:hypothetical protein
MSKSVKLTVHIYTHVRPEMCKNTLHHTYVMGYTYARSPNLKAKKLRMRKRNYLFKFTLVVGKLEYKSNLMSSCQMCFPTPNILFQ